jgi:predicted lipoprotein with Yx(FWY)xxD motif
MTWKRTAIGVTAVAVIAATALALGASGPTYAGAEPNIRRPAPKPAPHPVRPLLSVGGGAASGVLITPDGSALYYNDQDAASLACVGTCAKVWTPLLVTGTAPAKAPTVLGAVGVLVRPGGDQQVTYNGHPLYAFTVDAPGHVTGDGVLDSFDAVGFDWHAATATGAPLHASPTPVLPLPGASVPAAPASPGVPSASPGVPSASPGVPSASPTR